MPLELLNDLAQERLSTSRASLMNAFKYLIEMAGRRQVTDLHVRRLLSYVRAHDRYYTGVARSLAQLASILVLSVPTCRRVIRRAVDEFNLLIVIPQRHHPGGQTYNRYTINWDAVDSLLLDIENVECAAAHDTNQMPVRFAPAQRNAGLGNNAQNDAEGLKARPFVTMNIHRPSTYNEPDLEDLITEDRILSSHPRLLLMPDHLIPEDWPFARAARTKPKGTPKVLLAHFDVLLTKLQTAIDFAQQLSASNIEDRLRTLWDKLSAIHYRASHAALCRTNLPPINPIPDFSWQSAPIDYPTTNFAACFSTLPNDQRRSDQPPSDPLESFPNPNTDNLSPVALSDQTLSHDSSYSPNTDNLQPNSPAICPSCYDLAPDRLIFSPVRLAPYSLQPKSSALAENNALHELHIALNELLLCLTAAIQCASDHGITWLQNRFTNIRLRIKALKRAAHAVSASLPAAAHPSASAASTYDLPPNSPAPFAGAARTPSCYDLAPDHLIPEVRPSPVRLAP